MARLFSEVNKGRVRMRHKRRKSSPFPFNNAGGRFSVSFAVWISVFLVLFIYFISQITEKTDGKLIRVHPNHLSVTYELEDIEEEPNFRLPPPHKRNPRAVKRRGSKKKPPAYSEFLDESSELHSVLFPDRRLAVGPNAGNDSSSTGYFYPGHVWLDTDGNPIQAHGGGILFDDRRKTYYWYGENKDGTTYHTQPKGTARVDIIGVSCYSSKNLWSWKYEGIVLRGEQQNVTHDLYKTNVLERPKVIYNSKTNQYVMWMHIDDGNYTKASVGVAVSKSPTGPFTYLYSMRPHGSDSRDMTLFEDDDGRAYLMYSARDNVDFHIGPLTEDYLGLTGVMKKILVRQHREAPAVFKHGGTYYMITSGCSGWAPNRAMAHAAPSIMGPWENVGNPCVGGNRVLRLTTFFSQSTFVLPLPGLPGSFIFMADRWNPSNLRDSRYVWLPLKVGSLADEPMDYSFGFPLWSRVSIFWHKRWRLPEGWKNVN
ncbi:hypothetical protein LUZ63_005970 [Rhynchospora breviuscula]|uniref:Uncharacterized protein n=1 Tax=Rhynchospora breviuscula TaxID=2022672 RepID=A0A9Q0CPA7_9POAL|nr:hypothetical protein LUZ63_005970 [Rhynchospora breviuscula]